MADCSVFKITEIACPPEIPHQVVMRFQQKLAIPPPPLQAGEDVTKKSLEVKELCPVGEKLYSDGFLQDVADVLQKCYPIYEYCYNLMQEYQALKDSPAPKEERSNVPHMVQAPKHDFMW